MGSRISLEKESRIKLFSIGKAKEKKETISLRIMGLFSIVLIVITFVFELFYAQSTFNYYYDNVAGALHSQAQYNAELYLTYLSELDLMRVVVENKNQFYRSNKSQVQILSNSGQVLYDSLASTEVGNVLETEDVLSAQESTPGIYKSFQKNKEKVMSLSYPLHNQTRQVGIIRLTTSLASVDRLIRKQILFAILFGLMAITSGIMLSYLVSRSIINPLISLTTVARKLADGQFDQRCDENLIGEIGELGSVLNFMSDNIEKNNRLKNDFISSVSHELRTPLTAIKGWSITLQSEGVSPDMNKEGLKIIEQESERLSSMVEDLLDFSRFSSGRISLNKTRFDVVEVSKRILSQFTPRIKEKEIDAIFNYSHEEIFFVADINRIKQLLLNILDNAIKFTPDGGSILFDISLKDDTITFSITDTGIGISDEEIALVTEKFWKGTSSQSHTGLGLSISEEIVNAHGGYFSIKSKLDVGTTVTASFPREII